MNFSDYQSGVWRQQFRYKSFLPAPVNVEWTWSDARINVLLEKASWALSSLFHDPKNVP